MAETTKAPSSRAIGRALRQMERDEQWLASPWKLTAHRARQQTLETTHGWTYKLIDMHLPYGSEILAAYRAAVAVAAKVYKLLGFQKLAARREAAYKAAWQLTLANAERARASGRQPAATELDGSPNREVTVATPKSQVPAVATEAERRTRAFNGDVDQLREQLGVAVDFLKAGLRHYDADLETLFGTDPSTILGYSGSATDDEVRAAHAVIIYTERNARSQADGISTDTTSFAAAAVARRAMEATPAGASEAADLRLDEEATERFIAAAEASRDIKLADLDRDFEPEPSQNLDPAGPDLDGPDLDLGL